MVSLNLALSTLFAKFCFEHLLNLYLYILYYLWNTLFKKQQNMYLPLELNANTHTYLLITDFFLHNSRYVLLLWCNILIIAKFRKSHII